MKILLLNLYYPPDTSATAKMAHTVVDTICIHHRVTVLCGRPSYDPSERRPWRPYQTENVDLVRIIRAGSTAFPRFSMKKRLMNYLSYVMLAVPRALFVDCDVVLAMTDPPFQGIVGAFVAMLKRKPYVYNIRDLYPDMAVGGDILRRDCLVRIWEKLHRWALRRATRVIVLGEDMRARIVAKRVQSARVVVIRDGAEVLPPNASMPPPDPQVVRAIRGNCSFVLLHAGNLGFYGAWNTLVTAARRLSKEGVGLVFVGGGAQRSAVEAAAAGADNIRFLDYFPSTKIPSVLAAADAHIVTIKHGLEGVVVPSKMYGILAAGKPIVAVAPKGTDVVSLGATQGFAASADPDNPAELVSVVRTLMADAKRLHSMGLAAQAAAPSYDRVREFQRYLELFHQFETDST
ncbi:MAG TPA: glycosyltransferase family 4 protein [Candidatus Acidoferrum sp.]